MFGTLLSYMSVLCYATFCPFNVLSSVLCLNCAGWVGCEWLNDIINFVFRFQKVQGRRWLSTRRRPIFRRSRLRWWRWGRWRGLLGRTEYVYSICICWVNFGGKLVYETRMTDSGEAPLISYIVIYIEIYIWVYAPTARHVWNLIDCVGCCS